MFFPFKIQLNGVLILKENVQDEDILMFAREALISESYNVTRNFVIKQNKMTFGIDMGQGSGMFMKAVDKGIYQLDVKDNVMTLKYTYYTGLLYLYFTMAAVGLILIHQKPKGESTFFLFAFLFFWLILSWVSTFLNQKSMFKKIVGQIEDKWGYYKN